MTEPVPRTTADTRSPVFIIMLCCLIALISAAAGSYVTYTAILPATQEAEDEVLSEPEPEPDPDPVAVIDPALERFMRVFSLVRDTYVEYVDENDLWEGAAEGLVRAVGDPYSAYLDMSDYEELMERTTGSYAGIGAILTQVNDYTVIVSPFPDTPAEYSGLKPGDKIIAVDGRDMVGVPLDVVVTYIRGPAGTEVELTVVRDEDQWDVIVERDVIQTPTVSSDMISDDIAYLQISQFTWTTADDVREHLDQLLDQGFAALILDLRNNPGGDVDACIEVADMFLSGGKIVELVDRDGVEETHVSQIGGADYPIAILINRGTASAGEILAAALADHDVGILIGSNTFGKASVQTIYSLDSGTGIKLTTARYVTPAGHSLDGAGLTPDIKVDSDEERSEIDSAIEYLEQLLADK